MILSEFLELTDNWGKRDLYWTNIPMVTLDHSVYKQIVSEIIRWNEVLRSLHFNFMIGDTKSSA